MLIGRPSIRCRRNSEMPLQVTFTEHPHPHYREAIKTLTKGADMPLRVSTYCTPDAFPRVSYSAVCAYANGLPVLALTWSQRRRLLQMEKRPFG